MRYILYAVFLLAIFYGLFLPGGSFVRNASKEGQAANDLLQLVTAVEAYHTDYGVYPIDPAAHWTNRAMYDFPGGDHHNFEVVNVLRADTDQGPNSGIALNPREIVYLDVPSVKDNTHPKSGLGTSTTTNALGINAPGEWYDPWGNPYLVAIDTTGKGISDLGFIYSDANLAAPNSIKPAAKVVCISLGPDGKPGHGGNGIFAGSDDVLRSGTMR